MIRVGGLPAIGEPGADTEFCGLLYPDGDEISKHMAARLQAEPFYQSDKLYQALGFLKRRRIAVDCGAWVGGWSRELARHFTAVLAIEANPDNARCVSANTAHCGNVVVKNVALGDENRRAVGVAREVHGPNVGSRVLAERPLEALEVEMTRLDDLADLSDMMGVDYIKVHVNGMELKALRGAAETIKRHKPVLTVVLKPALADYGDTPEAAREFLKTLGYRAAGGERPYEIWMPS